MTAVNQRSQNSQILESEMINSKLSLHTLLAAAAMASASLNMINPAPQATSRRRKRYDERMAQQKRFVEQRMTDEQQAWNAAVEAKRTAKKVRSK